MMLRILLVALTLFILISGIVAFFVIRAGKQMAETLVYPARNPAQSIPVDFGFSDWEDVRFKSNDLELAGWFIPPDSNITGATLIMIHGWTANRSDLLDRARILSDHGYGILAIDLRNSGNSKGNTSTWGYSEADDVQAAYNYLLTRPEVNPKKIGIYGFSTGGAAVARAATQNSDIKVVLIESTYTALVDNLGNVVNLLGRRIPAYPPLVLWFMEQETGLPLRDIRPIDDVKQIAPRPIMFLQGTNDVVVDQNHSQKLFEAASEPKQLYLAPNAGHGEVFSSNPDEFEKQVIPFLDTYLKE